MINEKVQEKAFGNSFLKIIKGAIYGAICMGFDKGRIPKI